MIHAAVVMNAQSFLGAEGVGEVGIGIPVDKFSLRGGVCMEVALIIMGKTDAGASAYSPFLFYHRIIKTGGIGEDIELVVVAIQRVEAAVFPILGLVERISVGMAVVDGQAIGSCQKRNF